MSMCQMTPVSAAADSPDNHPSASLCLELPGALEEGSSDWEQHRRRRRRPVEMLCLDGPAPGEHGNSPNHGDRSILSHSSCSFLTPGSCSEQTTCLSISLVGLWHCLPCWNRICGQQGVFVCPEPWFAHPWRNLRAGQHCTLQHREVTEQPRERH